MVSDTDKGKLPKSDDGWAEGWTSLLDGGIRFNKGSAGVNPTDAQAAPPAAAPSRERTAGAFLMEIVGDLARLHEGDASDAAFRRFIEGPFGETWRVKADPDARIAELGMLQAAIREEASKGKKARARVALAALTIHAAMSCCDAAAQALHENRERLAWTFLMEAQALRANLLMLQGIAVHGPKLAADAQRRAADGAHAEHRSMKAQVLAFFAEHRVEYTTLEDAADKIDLAHVVPMKRGTIRDWLTGQKLK